MEKDLECLGLALKVRIIDPSQNIDNVLFQVSAKVREQGQVAQDCQTVFRQGLLVQIDATDKIIQELLIGAY